MTEIKRWHLPFDFGGVEMEVSSGGNYVRYDDHLAEISALRARVAELEARAAPIDDAELLELAEAEVKRMLATPPDSDAVRVLKAFSVYTIEEDDGGIRFSTGGVCIAHHGDGTPEGVALLKLSSLQLAALSNQGSSSNGQ